MFVVYTTNVSRETFVPSEFIYITKNNKRYILYIKNNCSLIVSRETLNCKEYIDKYINIFINIFIIIFNIISYCYLLLCIFVLSSRA